MRIICRITSRTSTRLRSHSTRTARTARIASHLQTRVYPGRDGAAPATSRMTCERRPKYTCRRGNESSDDDSHTDAESHFAYFEQDLHCICHEVRGVLRHSAVDWHDAPPFRPHGTGADVYIGRQERCTILRQVNSSLGFTKRG